MGKPMNKNKGTFPADLDPIIKDVLPVSETYKTEQEILDCLERLLKLLAPLSRAIDEGGGVSEKLARLAKYVEHDSVVAYDTGSERGRGWAIDQGTWDPRWVILDVHSARDEHVAVNAWDLAYSSRDREYGVHTEEYVNSFLEAAQEYFREKDS
jgi:hypothetical protein